MSKGKSLRCARYLDIQNEKVKTVDNDLTKFKRRCLTTWLDSEGRVTGFNALYISQEYSQIGEFMSRFNLCLEKKIMLEITLPKKEHI